MTETRRDDVAGDGRRGFFAQVFTGLGLGSLAASLVGTMYANFRFFFPKVLYEPPSKFKAGLPGDYQPGHVDGRWVKDHQVWIVREGAQLYALLAVCTHLGCLTSYFPGEKLFKCPCHGSNFSLEGDPRAGPAPEPLFRLELSWADDGQIVVDKMVQENRPGEREQHPYVLEV